MGAPEKGLGYCRSKGFSSINLIGCSKENILGIGVGHVLGEEGGLCYIIDCQLVRAESVRLSIGWMATKVLVKPYYGISYYESVWKCEPSAIVTILF